MVATSLLAGALGAGLGAGAVIATDDETTTPSTTTAGEVGGVSTTHLPDGSVARVADKVLPSVVSIQFTGAQGSGSGSGIVIDESGLILTNNHVVEGAADGGSLSVAFQDGTSTSAEIVGRDPSADLAVIRVDGVDNLRPSSSVRPTTFRWARPSSPSAHLSVSAVPSRPESSAPRTVRCFQEAPPATSRCSTPSRPTPRSTLATPVARSSTSRASSSASTPPSPHLAPLPGAQSGSIGLGFAIPIDQAKWIADQLIDNGTAQHARLGVSVESATGEVRGAAVKTVEPGSTADEIGLEVDDVITGFDTQTIDSADSLVAAVRSAEPGTTVTITVVRGGDTETLDATLAADTTTS